MHIMKLFKSFSEQSFENYYQNLEWLGFLINLEIKYVIKYIKTVQWRKILGSNKHATCT